MHPCILDVYESTDNIPNALPQDLQNDYVYDNTCSFRYPRKNATIPRAPQQT
jgi:hypothetical protein